MSDVTLKKITEADLVEKEPENKEPESEVLGEQYENTDDSHISTNTGSNVLGAEYAQAPKTGDASNYGSLCVLMLIAIATFAVAYRKKQMN